MESVAEQDQGAFAFIQALSADLNKGDIELPSFPDVVLRIREALEDENCSTDTLVHLISAETVLAARLLSIANSPALRPSGDPITDLNMAVTRVGRVMIRNSAMSFAMTQLKKAAKLGAVKEHLEGLWKQCAHVAALCFVLSRKYTKLNPDEALFVGMMHGIGNMYVIVRAEEFPALFESKDDLESAVSEWGAAIGSSIVESWGFASHVADAVRNYQDTARSHDGLPDYTDVLIVAHILYQFTTTSEDAEFALDEVPAAGQMSITAEDMLNVLAGSEVKINLLRQALGS